MPQSLPIPVQSVVDIDAPWEKYRFDGDTIADDYAHQLVDRTLFRFEMWRSQNTDPRWRLNEWLYYGYVPPKVWEGSSVPRSSIPWQIAFDQVEAANVKLYRELLFSDEIIGVAPEGPTDPLEAQQLRDRLLYILDHNIDDEGWTARMELKLGLKDMLIYGNCFFLPEWDGLRKQGTVIRLDPRDVYVDPATPSPNANAARAKIVRRNVTVDDIAAMRDFKSFKIPTDGQLTMLAENRSYLIGDRAKSTQEAARGVRYQPVADDMIPMPSARYMDLFIYMGQGREIWQLGRGDGTSFVIYNAPSPYGCDRLVSAPCFTVPNRFYAQSYVDVLDPLQQLGTALINRHVDEVNLAMNPPRSAKLGPIRPPSLMAWRPGAVHELANPKEDQIVYQPQGITSNVWETLSWVKSEAESRTGQSSMATSGQPTPSNANRTAHGVQSQLQAPMERLSEIADNFEQYALVPLMYKLLKIEKVHAQAEQGITLYGKRSNAPPGTGTTGFWSRS